MRSTTYSVVLVALIPLLQSCVPLVVGAGVGAGVMMAEDRRTNATLLEDQAIELRTGNRINEKYKDQGNISVTSFNRFVLLTGQVPTEEMKKDLSLVPFEVPNVRNFKNKIFVRGGSPS